MNENQLESYHNGIKKKKLIQNGHFQTSNSDNLRKSIIISVKYLKKDLVDITLELRKM